MSYEVGFKPSALREVRKLDEVTRKAIISEVELLADNPLIPPHHKSPQKASTNSTSVIPVSNKILATTCSRESIALLSLLFRVIF